MVDCLTTRLVTTYERFQFGMAVLVNGLIESGYLIHTLFWLLILRL